MSKVIAAEARITATDATGKVFDNLGKKIEGVAKSAKAIEGIKPFQKMGWGADMQKQMDGLKLSARELDAVNKSWTGLHQTLAATPRTMAQTVNAMGQWKQNTLANLRQIKMATEQTEASHVKYLRNTAKFAVGAMGVGIGAHEVGRGIRAATKLASARNREVVREEMAGLTPDQRAIAARRASELSTKYPSLSRTEIMQDIRENTSRLGGFDRSLAMADVFQRAKLAIRLSGGDEHSLGKVARALEGAGQANSPQDFEEGLNAWVKARAVNADYKEEDFANDMRTAAMAKYGMSKEYRENVFPVLASHVPGFGNKLSTAASAVVGGRMTKAAKGELGKFGLMGKDGRPIDPDLWLRNNFEWTQKYVRPILEKQGVQFGEHMSEDDKVKISKFGTRIASARNMSDLIISNLLDEPLVKRYAGKNALGTDRAQDMASKDADTAYESVKKQMGDFTTALLNLGPAIDAMNWFAKRTSEFTDKFQNGTTGEKVGTGILAGATVATGGGLAAWLGSRAYQGFTGVGKMNALMARLAAGTAPLAESVAGGATGGLIAGVTPRALNVLRFATGPVGAALMGAVQGDVLTGSTTERLRARLAGDQERWRQGRDFTLGSDRTFSSSGQPAGFRRFTPNAGEFGAAAPQEGFGNYKELQVQLVGSAEVTGSVELTHKVEATSEFFRLVEMAKQVVKLSGSLIANGPGSNGRTSPDANPGLGGRHAGPI